MGVLVKKEKMSKNIRIMGFKNYTISVHNRITKILRKILLEHDIKFNIIMIICREMI